MRYSFLILCILLCLTGCSNTPVQEVANNTPTPEITVTPTPTQSVSTISQSTSIVSAVEQFMGEHGYKSTELVQLGETYIVPGYAMAVVSGKHSNNDNEYNGVHLVHLKFENAAFSVINMYPGQGNQIAGYYPNVVNINGRTIVWTTYHETDDSNKFANLRFYYTDGTNELMPIAGESAVYRLSSGTQVTRIVPVSFEGAELEALAFGEEALTPIVNVTEGNEVSIDPITGDIIAVCGYPTAPDKDSDHMLKEALLESGLMSDRPNYSLISAKEYSGKIYACITYSRNDDQVHELVIGSLTLEGSVEIIGVCEFEPPDETGYKMYSTAIENDIICWTLLSETRLDGSDSVLMDFNVFRFYWDNNEYKDDYVIDRFFIYFNKHVPLPTSCTPIVNGNELTELSESITRVEFKEP